MTNYPIKVRWTGKARWRIQERIYPEDNTDWGCCKEAFNRQETNIVLESEKEVEDFLSQTESYTDSDDCVWLTEPQSKAIRRVRSEVQAQLEDGGSEEPEPEPEPEQTTKADLPVEPGDLVSHSKLGKLEVERIDGGKAYARGDGSLSTFGESELDRDIVTVL